MDAPREGWSPNSPGGKVAFVSWRIKIFERAEKKEKADSHHTEQKALSSPKYGAPFSCLLRVTKTSEGYEKLGLRAQPH